VGTFLYGLPIRPGFGPDSVPILFQFAPASVPPGSAQRIDPCRLWYDTSLLARRPGPGDSIFCLPNPKTAMNRTLIALSLLPILLLTSAAMAAEPPSLSGCRTITDATARLACYDALPLNLVPAAAASGSAKPRQTPEQFGLEQRKQVEELEVIESAIAGNFDDWKPNQWIKLTNGQIWQVIDDSDGYVRNSNSPKVKIQRGLFGAFYMEIETGNRTVKVKRIK
jgi:hypothetical protein